MKKIKTILVVFCVFISIVVFFLFMIHDYSTKTLQSSLMGASEMQLSHSVDLLEKKAREIEMEAAWILLNEDIRQFHYRLSDKSDVYEYVMGMKSIKEYLQSRQKSNVGMSSFILYWPEDELLISTGILYDIDQEMLKCAEEKSWFSYGSSLYYAEQFLDTSDSGDEGFYILIETERDYLYQIKNMTTGIEGGGTLVLLPDGSSAFSVNDTEREIISLVNAGDDDSEPMEESFQNTRYYIIKESVHYSGLELISYNPVESFMAPINNITRWTILSIMGILLIGLFFMILYYKNIMVQLKVLTMKLHMVEEGDLNVQIEQFSDNEFDYVFERFNHMVTGTRRLMTSLLDEQELKKQAEFRQLQFQINPHFLYNSLSYIVAVAYQPEAVIDMASHLSEYYRHCTRQKVRVTVGEELDFVNAYLAIMALRKSIDYQIIAPKEVHSMPILPLLLQPIVENAIEHGIEKSEHAHRIVVEVLPIDEGQLQFKTADDGRGILTREVERLEAVLNNKKSSDSSVGLWNVNQRLCRFYGDNSKLHFNRNGWEGLTVSFIIKPKEVLYEGINS